MSAEHGKFDVITEGVDELLNLDVLDLTYNPLTQWLDQYNFSPTELRQFIESRLEVWLTAQRKFYEERKRLKSLIMSKVDGWLGTGPTEEQDEYTPNTVSYHFTPEQMADVSEQNIGETSRLENWRERLDATEFGSTDRLALEQRIELIVIYLRKVTAHIKDIADRFFFTSDEVAMAHDAPIDIIPADGDLPSPDLIQNFSEIYQKQIQVALDFYQAEGHGFSVKTIYDLVDNQYINGRFVLRKIKELIYQEIGHRFMLADNLERDLLLYKTREQISLLCEKAQEGSSSENVSIARTAVILAVSKGLITQPEADEYLRSLPPQHDQT